ncbi:MAG: hypothetical protein GY909_15760 [Oligoflexia bacterium]|nr:hypothetical protein [Oligoflexia bacterium]
MLYALVENTRRKPSPNLRGHCPYCNSEMVSKCGKINIWHWAHKTKVECDSWHENETQWHRDWKNLYPESWQEVIHFDDHGEKHISDIKRPDGFFIEIQHSPITKEEVDSRNSFYKNIAWIVNGSRLERDQTSFEFILNTYSPVDGVFDITNKGIDISKKWADVAKPVFLDFNQSEFIYYLFKKNSKTFLFQILKNTFIEKSKIKGGLSPLIKYAHRKILKLYNSIEEQRVKREYFYKPVDQKSIKKDPPVVWTSDFRVGQRGYHVPLKLYFFNEDLETYYNNLKIGQVFASTTFHKFMLEEYRLINSEKLRVVVKNISLGGFWEIIIYELENGALMHDFKMLSLSYNKKRP